MQDIAVRALSPDVNNPTTAEHTILRSTSVPRTLVTQPVPPTIYFADKRLTI